MATIISLVSYPFLPARVGGQKGVALFNKYFSAYHRLICVTTRANDPRAAEGYEVLNILSNSPLRYLNIFYFFTLRRIIKKNGADYILLEHPYYGWLGILLKWFAGVELIVHSHNIEGLRWKTLGKWWWSLLWSYERMVHRAARVSFFIHDEDREYAITHFGLKPETCLTVTYGIEWAVPPAATELQAARSEVRRRWNIPAIEKILLFNGAFNYHPNIDALRHIVESINPLLKDKKSFAYRIVICGRDIPELFTGNPSPHILYAGFVEDISLYFKAADVFLNPVTEGGGIKTKLVEALGYNINAVSTITGALGVDPAICGGKLMLAADNDWPAFVNRIPEAAYFSTDIPDRYFHQFYWGYTAKRAAAFIPEKA